MVERNESWDVHSSIAGRSLSISYECCSSSRNLADSRSARWRSAQAFEQRSQQAYQEDCIDLNSPVRDIRLTIGSSSES